jgi:hypothetical protein
MLVELLGQIWKARPDALFAAILEWWLEHALPSTKSARCDALLQLLRAATPDQIAMGEVLTVGCGVLAELYNLAKTQDSSTVNTAAELQWSNLCQRKVAEVEPAWVTFMTTFINSCTISNLHVCLLYGCVAC